MKRPAFLLSFVAFGLSVVIGMLMPVAASAANPPQCYAPLVPGSGAIDCGHKSDSFPASNNGGQFLPNHCYTLQPAGAFGNVYFDTPCSQAPFNGAVASGSGQTTSNGQCDPKSSFFGFPTWYKYLKGDVQYLSFDGKVLDPATDDVTGPGAIKTCTPHLNGLNDIWLIVAAVIEILLRVAALAAIVLVVWGGIQYVMSQGEPDKTNKARSTIINALIGLVIAIGAATFVSFVAGRFK